VLLDYNIFFVLTINAMHLRDKIIVVIIPRPRLARLKTRFNLSDNVRNSSIWAITLWVLKHEAVWDLFADTRRLDG